MLKLYRKQRSLPFPPLQSLSQFFSSFPISLSTKVCGPQVLNLDFERDDIDIRNINLSTSLSMNTSTDTKINTNRKMTLKKNMNKNITFHTNFLERQGKIQYEKLKRKRNWSLMEEEDYRSCPLIYSNSISTKNFGFLPSNIQTCSQLTLTTHHNFSTIASSTQKDSKDVKEKDNIGDNDNDDDDEEEIDADEDYEADYVEENGQQLREAFSRKNNIRMSPWKINLLARQVRGMPVAEALVQMSLSRKAKGSPIVAKVIQNAANLMGIRYGLFPEQLIIDQCFVNRSFIQKGLMIQGRSRAGLKKRRYSHVVVIVKEIDFDDKINSAKNKYQKKRWEQRRDLMEKLQLERGLIKGEENEEEN